MILPDNILPMQLCDIVAEMSFTGARDNTTPVVITPLDEEGECTVTIIVNDGECSPVLVLLQLKQWARETGNRELLNKIDYLTKNTKVVF